MLGLALMAAAHGGIAHADESGDSFRHPTAYDDLVCSFSWPCAKAQAVMFCESSGNPRATDGYNHGLMQVWGGHVPSRAPSIDSLYDPITNLQVAHQLWLEQGWGPWPSCGKVQT